MGTFTDRTQVRETFGPPISVSETAGGGAVETFHSRRKFSEPEKGIGICMADVLTLGLAELYLFPHEVVIASWRSVVGQRLEVEYDREGRVTNVRRDGEPMLLIRQYTPSHLRMEPNAPYLPGSATKATTTGTARFAQPSP